jgi:uncharacterized protein (DUF433 family)
VNTTYVEQRDGRYAVTDTRVSLDSIVYGFLSGQSAESLAQAFPVLTLEQVYGAITFYPFQIGLQIGVRFIVDDRAATARGPRTRQP